MADFADDLLQGMMKPPEKAADEAPSGGTDTATQIFEQMNAAAPQKKTEAPKLPSVPDVNNSDFEGQTLQIGLPLPGLTDKSIDTHIPLPSFITKGLAQLGSGLADAGQGYKQFNGLVGLGPKVTEQQVNEKRRMDEPLNKGVAGTINNFAGNIAPYAVAAPEGIVGSLLAGGTQGVMQPVGTGDSRAMNTGIGFAMPAGMGILKAAKNLPAEKVMGPLSREASDQGYNVTLGDSSDNALVRGFKELTDKIPGFGGSKAGNEAVNRANFNTKVASTWGGTADSITDKSKLISDKKRIVDDMQSVWKNNTFEPDTTSFARDIKAVRNKPGMSEDVQNAIDKQIELLDSNTHTDSRGIKFIDGEGMKRMQSQLFAADSTNPAMNEARDELRQVFLDHYKAQLKPKDAAKLEKSMGQYRAFATAEDTVLKAVQGNTKTLNPAELGEAVRNKYGTNASPYDDIIRVGREFVKDAGPQKKSAGATASLLGANVALPTIAHLAGSATLAPLTAAATGIGYLANKGLNSPGAYRLATGAGDVARAVADKIPSSISRGIGAGVRRLGRPAMIQGPLEAAGGFRRDQEQGRALFNQD